MDDYVTSQSGKSTTVPIYNGQVGAKDSSAFMDFGYVPLAKAENQHQSQVVLNEQAHQYTKEQMAYSAQLQADAEKRAQEYNDPRAQKARGAAAGYSPEAMLGSSGAYEMGVSSAPSAPGASPGTGSDGGASLASILGSVASLVNAGSGVASGVAGIAESGARKKLIDVQARRETLGAMRDMVDTVLYPRLALAKLNTAEAQAVVDVINANMDYSWFSSYDENGTPLWKREKLEDLRGKIKQNVKLDAEKLNLVMSAFKNFADGNLSFTQAEDIVNTQDSRIAANYGSSEKDIATAEKLKEETRGMQLSNDDYEKYGIDKNSELMGVPLLPIVRWFEDFERSMLDENPKGIGRLLTSILSNAPKKAWKDVKSMAQFISQESQKIFNKPMSDENAQSLATTIYVTHPHYGSRHGVYMATH